MRRLLEKEKVSVSKDCKRTRRCQKLWRIWDVALLTNWQVSLSSLWVLAEDTRALNQRQRQEVKDLLFITPCTEGSMNWTSALFPLSPQVSRHSVEQPRWMLPAQLIHTLVRNPSLGDIQRRKGWEETWSKHHFYNPDVQKVDTASIAQSYYIHLLKKIIWNKKLLNVCRSMRNPWRITF